MRTCHQRDRMLLGPPTSDLTHACACTPCRTIEPYEDFPCSTVAFDYTGLYLGVGGADARVYGQKQV